MTVDLPDLAAMAAFGARIAARLRPGDVVALSGGLGVGKTTLARAIIATLGHEGEVPSPTFTIVEVYDDADAFTAHRESAHFAAIGKMQIIPLLESRVVVGYEGDGVIG